MIILNTFCAFVVTHNISTYNYSFYDYDDTHEMLVL